MPHCARCRGPAPVQTPNGILCDLLFGSIRLPNLCGPCRSGLDQVIAAYVGKAPTSSPVATAAGESLVGRAVGDPT